MPIKSGETPNYEGNPCEYDEARSTLWQTYAPPESPIFERGKGTKLYSEDGREYFDFITGIAVNSFGHAHPHLVQALTLQANELWHVSNLYRVPAAERLASRLCERSFADRAFFCNSGTEAIEAGIKAMRRYHHNKGNGERYRVIGFEGSFHGRSIAALAAAGNKSHCDGFIPFDYGFSQVAWQDMDAIIKAAKDSNTAGFIIEPIQGEGGIRCASDSFLQQLRSICDEHDLLLMVDEVQCGIGRSGHLFAHEKSAAKPDIMSLAKGLGGGFPIGACLVTEGVSVAMGLGSHGSTFGGNPLAMAVGNAVLDLTFAPELLPDVMRKGTLFSKHLKALASQYPSIISDVSGRGLMIGMSCVIPNLELLNALRERGLLVGKSGANMIRFLPPLNVTDDEIFHALDVLKNTLADLSH